MSIDLVGNRDRALRSARHILDNAATQGRDVTPAEEAEVSQALADVKRYDVQLKAQTLSRQVFGHDGGWQEEDHGGTGNQVFTSEAKQGIAHAVKTRTAYRTEVDSKALITTSAMLPTSGTAVQEGLHPNSHSPLASLFTNAPADGPVVRYYQMTAGTAAVTAEGGLKAASGVSISAVDLSLSKLTSTAVYSSEMGDDAPFLVTYLGNELAAAVTAAENKLVPDTFAATSGVLTGTVATTAVVDGVADVIASAEALSGITPAAIIANPTVVASIRKSKASTSGVYNVDILSTSPTMLHGVRLISSPATVAGTAWMVSTSGITIYRRGPVSVEVGLDGTDWSHNTHTMIAEEQVGVAAMRPNALYKLTLT